MFCGTGPSFNLALFREDIVYYTIYGLLRTIVEKTLRARELNRACFTRRALTSRQNQAGDLNRACGCPNSVDAAQGVTVPEAVPVRHGQESDLCL